MITSYQIPNYWTWQLFLCIVDKGTTANEIVKYYNDVLKINMVIDKDDDGGCPCCLYDVDELVAVVCIDEWKLDPYHIGIIAHEVMHVLTCISDICGCPMDMHTSECWAYSMSSLMDTFIQILEKHDFNSKRKRRRCKKRHSIDHM